jgi:putative nucleotidyltransferase with HDIG domain
MRDEHQFPEAMIQMLESIEKLPSLPEVASLVLNLINDPDSSAQDVTRVLVRDPATASQLLRLVNSAYYSLPEKISDLNKAITLVGFNKLKELTLSTAFFKLFKSKGIPGRFNLQDFWKHCVISAGICREIENIRKSQDQEIAYVSGLLHDIGMLVELEFFPDKLKHVTVQVEQGGQSVVEAEMECFGYTHADIGAWLSNEWKLSDTVTESIQHHHHPEKYGSVPFSNSVNVANFICRKIGVTPIQGEAEKLSEMSWEQLAIEKDHLFTLHERAERENTFAEIILMH